MKFSLKTLAAAVVLAAAATGASAAIIDKGANGDGGLFFNIWDGASSYTLNLGYTINSFESAIAEAGAFNQVYQSDNTLDSFLQGRDLTKMKFSVLAVDGQGARRFIETYTEPSLTQPLPTPTSLDKPSNYGSIATAIQTGLTGVNAKLASTNSATYTSTDPGYFGKATLSGKMSSAGLQSFSNIGTLASNSFASGMSLLRVDAASVGSTLATFSQYTDGSAIRVWVDSSNDLHIAAVPEPESYAMLLAGLGMLGFMARRRLNNRA